MVWLVVHGILIVFSISMSKFWVPVSNYFGKMTDFFNFEAVKDSNVNEISDTEENLDENVSDHDFIDDGKEFNESVADYYAFTNASRSVEGAMQDSFIDFDYSREANNYFPEDYDLNYEINDEFKDSGKKVEDFKSTVLIPQGFENINSFYYAPLYAIRYQSKKLEKWVCKWWQIEEN